MERFKVDFDDSMTYQAMRNLKADQAVSFDKDLKKIPSIKRLDPKQVKKKITRSIVIWVASAQCMSREKVVPQISQ
jgi:hypothetical protein